MFGIIHFLIPDNDNFYSHHFILFYYFNNFKRNNILKQSEISKMMAQNLVTIFQNLQRFIFYMWAYCRKLLLS